MKRENWLYLFAFLCGVVCINVLGIDAWAGNNLLNRYYLAMLSFEEITYETYLIHILFVRFRTMIGLWVFTKLIGKKATEVGFGGIMSAALGAVLAILILINGIWGILFFFCAFLPHGIFYGVAYLFWCNLYSSYTTEGTKRENRFALLLIFLFMMIGSICEAYICPVFIKKII